VQAGRSTHFLRTGNDHADHFAGRGVDVAEAMSPSVSDAEAYRQAVRWYKWLEVLAANWPDDMQRPSSRSVPPRQSVVQAGPSPPVLHADHPHELAEDGGRLVCRRCPRYVGLKSSLHLRRLMAGSVCLRSVGDRARVANESSPNDSAASIGYAGPQGLTPGLGHMLFLSGELVWCRKCGCYGERRFKALKRTCQGPAVGGRATQLQRLLEGRHPVSKRPIPRAIRWG
jgi:hypothetical protein